MSSPAAESTVDPAEVAKFEAIADSWWDPEGAFRPLHRFNPVRLAYLRATIARRFDRPATGPLPFTGLRVLDVGCGGGLLAEPMARLGALVTGIDASARNIAVAAHHAARDGVDVTYRHATVEALVDEAARFDVVLSMEVVEHVAAPDKFVADCARLVAPGGLLVAATLNRTAESFLKAIVGAEYVLRWLPRGTHDWRRFVKPADLARWLRGAGLVVAEARGVAYAPLAGRFTLTTDLAVNYMMVAVKEP
jgi:2-polyprenyl-6-hydroxyphenyl methylase/3-demethylubiquinone-9 3-methyltransferase